jgi:hypothetical protein
VRRLCRFGPYGPTARGPRSSQSCARGGVIGEIRGDTSPRPPFRPTFTKRGSHHSANDSRGRRDLLVRMALHARLRHLHASTICPEADWFEGLRHRAARGSKGGGGREVGLGGPRARPPPPMASVPKNLAENQLRSRVRQTWELVMHLKVGATDGAATVTSDPAISVIELPTDYLRAPGTRRLWGWSPLCNRCSRSV